MATIKWSHPLRQDGTPEKFGLVSDCGRFRIGKYIAQGTQYGLFDGIERIGLYPSASEAQKAAEGRKKAPAG